MMINTGIMETEHQQEYPITASWNMLKLARRYFVIERRVSIFLIIVGLLFFLAGLCLALMKKGYVLNGMGIGFFFAGWFTIWNGILMNVRSEWQYIGACRTLSGDRVLLNRDFELVNHRLQYFVRWRLRLLLLCLSLLLLLHASAGIFWQGGIHAALLVSIVQLLSNEFRSYKFGDYWKGMCRELEQHTTIRLFGDAVPT